MCLEKYLFAMNPISGAEGFIYNLCCGKNGYGNQILNRIVCFFVYEENSPV